MAGKNGRYWVTRHSPEEPAELKTLLTAAISCLRVCAGGLWLMT
jgi:hypothetical protein